MSDRKSILLIHPPISKPCEPPAGIAKLVMALRSNGIDCRVFDASLEGLLYLLRKPLTAGDTWTRRASVKIGPHLRALRAGEVYSHADRYKKVVMDLNRIVTMAGRSGGVHISLSNYTDPSLAPVRSADLIRSARCYRENVFFPFFEERFTVLFSEKEPDIVGFSVNFMSQALCAFAMAGFIKNRFPDTRIVFGGGLITSWMNIPGFSNPFDEIVDHLVAGPGEHTLLSMCGAHGHAPASFTGLDYDLFPLDRYFSPGPILPYSTSSGCYWRRCRFCPETSEGGGYRPFASGEVLDDLRRLVRSMRPVLIHFLDNALSPRFLRHLIEQPPGIPWYGFVRITDHLADMDFVSGLRKSGCVMLKLGVESGDQAVLNALGKGVDLKTVSAALRTLQATGIASYIYLLFGTPAESLQSAEKTLAFTSAHADSIDFLNLAVFNLPAAGEEAKELDTTVFYPGDLSLYREFVHPQGWHRDQVRRYLEKNFKQQKSIRPIIHRNPSFFTSNHAPFLVKQSRLSSLL